MSGIDRNKFLEDDFDLNEYKKKSFILREHERFNEKNRKTIRFLSFLIMLLAIAIAYFAYCIGNYYIGLWRNETISERSKEITQSQTVPPQTAPTQPQATPTQPQATPAQPQAAPTQPTAAPTQPPQAIPTQPPDASPGQDAATAPPPRPVIDEIAELRSFFSNNDIVGYLQIEGTNIDYAVAQAADNEFYLQRDLYGEYNVAGSVFMDYENNLEELDSNTVIYGHNMKNGSMFHNLRYYADKRYYESHPHILLATPYEQTVWEIFSFYQTDTDFYYIQTAFADKASFDRLLSDIKEKAMYDTGVQVSANDKILTLSTCASISGNNRYVLNAKLQRD